MKCQKCNKNEATTHMTKIINGYKEELHLCADCAAESSEYKSMKSDMNVGLNDFLLGIIGGSKKHAPSINEQSAGVCPTCHMTYNDFLKTGKLGCGDCYEAFANKLIRPVRQIHGTCEHVGKVPARGGGEVMLDKKLSKLEADLNAAVLKQDFETAAKLRDEIKEIKSNGREEM